MSSSPKTALCIVTYALTSCASQRKSTSTTHHIKEKDSTYVDQIAILHRHDTLWLTKTETKNGEKQEFSTEIRENKSNTPPIMLKIITIETIIIVIILLIYFVKKRQKQ
ncbi:MAG: hypothetical protein J6A44_00175 [Paludibacteraceae bacterium]|nr:hypothetical protein [Paludibacteraceae bacterium]